jgi:hypothetical protein
MKDDGGQAFARSGSRDIRGYGVDDQEGMSMRQYYAAHAPAMTEQWYLDSGGTSRHWLDAQAEWSWAYADAMLKAETS